MQRAGNRFGVVSVCFGLLSGLGASFAGLAQLAWALSPMGMLLGGVGLALWLRNQATNRTDALIGLGLSYLVFMVLLFRYSMAHPLPETAFVPVVVIP